MDDGFALVVGRVDAPGAIRFEAALGQREMPHCTGVGKVLLAAMPRAEALANGRRVGHAARPPRTLKTLRALSADLDRVAQRHYAIDNEEDREGIICVAAAILGHDGRAAGAISVTTLKQLLPLSVVPSVAEPLLRHADQISKALGGITTAHAWALRADLRHESSCRCLLSSRRVEKPGDGDSRAQFAYCATKSRTRR